MAVRMPIVTKTTNPDSRTIGISTNQSTSIRIDDSSANVRKTWSSAKIQQYAQTSESQLVYQFVSNYGNLYYSDYDEAMYDEWTDVIKDAIKSLDNGQPFYVAWSENRSAQVIDVDEEAEPRMTVLIDGRAFAMSDTGIQEVPVYNIVLQYATKESFPQEGVKDRLYIDLEEDMLYYWNGNSGYKAIKGLTEPLHKLTFGAGEEYVYDGSCDVTVPVYLGDTR